MKRIIIGLIAVATLGGFAIVPAGANGIVDYGVFTLNGCTINTAGSDDTPNNTTQSYAYNANSCGKPTCIREAANLGGGNIYWASEAACTTGVAGQYSISPVVGGQYFGRQIRVGSTCYQDTVFTNPAVHACV